MNAKEWIDEVESHLGRKTRLYEQRFIARMYADDRDDTHALGVAVMLMDANRNPLASIFDES